MNECIEHGHRWRFKTVPKGPAIKVCIVCGTDEIRVAVKRLRDLAEVIRTNSPVGWPNVQTADAIDTVLNALGDQP